MTLTRRRILLAAGALAAASLARAQKPSEKRTLGVLSPHPKPPPEQVALLRSRSQASGSSAGASART
jgi:hypothetical protein